MDFEKFTHQLLELKNKQAQEMSIYCQQFDQADFHMLQHVIDYAKMGIKALFLLNGTAAVSVLTLFTSSSLDLKSVFTPLLDAVTLFSWGAICSIICILLAYITQIFYQDECACMGREKMLNVIIRQLDEEKMFLVKEKTTQPNTKDFFVSKIEDINVFIETKQNEISLEQNKEKKFGILGNFFSILSFLAVVVSLILFGLGVSTVKKGFIIETPTILENK